MDPQRTSYNLLRSLPLYEDAAAWQRFMGIYGPMVLAWARRWGLSSDDADEVTGMVLLKLAQRMKHFEYDPASRFRAWLRTVVDSQVKDFFAKRARWPSVPGGHDGEDRIDQLQEIVDHRSPIEAQEAELETIISPHVNEAMSAVRQRVTAHTWQAFQLTVCEGLKGTEVAKALGLPVASVHQARSRVARMLREELVQRMDSRA